MEPDCYKLLEIPPDADEKMIRRAWKLKTKETHPDVNDSAGASNEFMKFTAAMELLLDPTRRLQHDRHFGYYTKPKNQDSNAKQFITEFQQQKAEDLVRSWSGDYETAMRMREAQRKRVIERNKFRVRLVIVLLIVLVLAITGWIAWKI
jgi:curved DNA-binding protein CbpA